ncbi:MAG TPA: hypothetical protein VMW58_05420 [Anaerolineae bacterium]|nr:hypothetical protein [Anaerolineae bacterium]
MAEEAGKVTLGVTDSGAKYLEELMSTRWFSSEMAAYLLAVSTALSRKLAVSRAPLKGVTTKWNVGSLDRDGSLRELVRLMGPGDLQDPYEYAERLAEAGLQFLKHKIVDEELLLSDVLEPGPAPPIEAGPEPTR